MHDNPNNAVPRMPEPQCHSWFCNPIDYLPAGTGKCLDLGCGDQSAAQSVESRGYRWVGLDVETRFRRPRPRFVCGDGQALPFPADIFSAVFCNQVLEHIPSPEALLGEIYRVLQPAGVVVGSSSYIEPEHDRACFFHGSAHGIEYLLGKIGFVDQQITTGIHGPVLVAYHLLGRRVARLVGPMIRLSFELRCAAWRLWRSLRKSPNAEDYRDYRARKCLELAGHVVWRAHK